jgi:membrane protease YdiL (CAAX protease family)
MTKNSYPFRRCRQTNSPEPATPWLMLVSRSLLFLFFQGLAALLFFLAGNYHAWNESARWWVLTIIPANLVGIYLLVRLFKAEGRRYLDILRFSKATLGKDLLWLLVILFAGMPLAILPITGLSILIFGNATIPTIMLFQPIPVWALAVGLLFPLTIAFAELPTYFGYVMPRLAEQIKNGWAAWLIAAFFLGLQHSFLPLILDGRFMLWRLTMYLPFALFAGLLIKQRPSLLPYFAVVHALMDISTLAVYLAK